LIVYQLALSMTIDFYIPLRSDKTEV